MQNLFKIIIIFLSLISFKVFSQEINKNNQHLESEKSHYVSGFIIDTNTDENGLKKYVTKLKDGSTVDVDTY